MKALNKHAELRQLAEKATQGEWWSDVVETDGEYGEGEDRASGYHSYAVYVGSESLLDMTNSTAACIHTEWDHDYLMAWDETAKRNAEFIAAANPETVLALLDELEKAQAQSSKWCEAFHKAVSVGARYEERIEELERSETQLIDERDNAESALNDAYKAVMGQAPEWSNWFSFADAIDEIEVACGLWRNQTEDVLQFRARIAELEAKLANPVLLPKTNGYWNEQEKAYEEAITLARRLIRLAGFRCEGDE
ncbi:ead/Ea22-like family protein [Salmonella enterica]|uniref:Ead/Ea22-like family protein n=1 Tax=Salmonella enterica TaxID=28901 RepID=A0A5Y4CVF0_SALER|nr:ead/Ea22-like family protein [Salmonella enterica]EBX5947675.1 ead/Ea22-like family protein [Salmonella enterica subsp. enterica serovar Newport]EEE5691356.1 hypothetical protein [Salmonella enterica subsp. enterica serovar Muenchen]EBM5397689.1 ead/Ea22-like family protein [Salmonella enterica]EBT8286110.1 ead/Ea22-like family protein [Salmonella enterica]